MARVHTAIFAQPSLDWKVREVVEEVTHSVSQSKCSWVKKVVNHLACGAEVGVSAPVVAKVTVTKPADAAASSQPSCKLSPGDEVLTCAVAGGGGPDLFDEGTLRIWRHRESRHVEGVEMDKFDTRVMQGRSRRADGVFPDGHRLAIRTEEDVSGVTDLWLVVAVSMYAYKQKGQRVIEVNGADWPLKWWNVVKLDPSNVP
jgi:hypothetical protein